MSASLSPSPTLVGRDESLNTSSLGPAESVLLVARFRDRLRLSFSDASQSPSEDLLRQWQRDIDDTIPMQGLDVSDADLAGLVRGIASVPDATSIQIVKSPVGNESHQLDAHIRGELALIEAGEMSADDIQYHREKGKDQFFRSDGDRATSGEEEDLLTTAAYQGLRNAQAGGAMDTEESAIAIALTLDSTRDDSTQGARPTLYWRLEQGPNGNALRYHLEENAAARDDPVVQLLLGTAEGLSTGQLSSTLTGHEAARALVHTLDHVHSTISKADPDGYGKGLHPCERFSLRHAGDRSLLGQFKDRVQAQKSMVKGKGKA